MFAGNTDMETPEENILIRPLIARFIRIYPTACNNDICELHWELYGYRPGGGPYNNSIMSVWNQ